MLGDSYGNIRSCDGESWSEKEGVSKSTEMHFQDDCVPVRWLKLTKTTITMITTIAKLEHLRRENNMTILQQYHIQVYTYIYGPAFDDKDVLLLVGRFNGALHARITSTLATLLYDLFEDLRLFRLAIITCFTISLQSSHTFMSDPRSFSSFLTSI